MLSFTLYARYQYRFIHPIHPISVPIVLTQISLSLLSIIRTYRNKYIYIFGGGGEEGEMDSIHGLKQMNTYLIKRAFFFLGSD